MSEHSLDGAESDDPFGKVKSLIADLISKLESEAGAEASEKAYCDEQIANMMGEKTLDKSHFRLKKKQEKADEKEKSKIFRKVIFSIEFQST